MKYIFYKMRIISIIFFEVFISHAMEQKMIAPQNGGIYLFYDYGWQVSNQLGNDSFEEKNPLTLTLSFPDIVKEKDGYTVKGKYYYNLANIIKTNYVDKGTLDLDISEILLTMNLHSLEIFQEKEKQIEELQEIIKALTDKLNEDENRAKQKEENDIFHFVKNNELAFGIGGLGLLVGGVLALYNLSKNNN